MESLQIKLKNYPKTFEDFRKWLFLKLERNTGVFSAFFKNPLSIQCFYFLEFLEAKSVPVLDALCYQRYHRITEPFIFISYHTIIYEFMKLEKGLQPKLEHYKPF